MARSVNLYRNCDTPTSNDPVYRGSPCALLDSHDALPDLDVVGSKVGSTPVIVVMVTTLTGTAKFLMPRSSRKPYYHLRSEYAKDIHSGANSIRYPLP